MDWTMSQQLLRPMSHSALQTTKVLCPASCSCSAWKPEDCCWIAGAPLPSMGPMGGACSCQV